MTFYWTAFRDRYAANAVFESNSWEDYVRENNTLANTTLPKTSAPGIYHGRVREGRRTADAIVECSALVIDSDKDLLSESDRTALVDSLKGHRFFFASRRGKFHLVLPFKEPITTPTEIHPRREFALTHFAKRLQRTLDFTTSHINSILHPYTRLPEMLESESVFVASSVEGEPLDLDNLLAEGGYRARPARARQGYVQETPKQAEGFTSELLKALDKRGLLYDRGPLSDRRSIRCPFHPDDSRGPGDTSTILFTESNWIHCSHNRCYWKHQPDYWRELGISSGNIPVAVTALLEASVTPRVSLDDAGRQIRKALMAAKPYEHTATVVRVTAGAGKTRAVAEYLDTYCTPKWDSETGDVIAGRTAFLATPTNALMREVSTRIGVEHRKATGVLAVIDSGGNPLCAKWATAKRLQEAGGDVHRLMCAKCEVRESCGARSGCVTGDGALTLTNHTLLPSLVRASVEAGKVPLIVWDESPSFVEVRRLTFAELEWLLDRFDHEDDPRSRVSLARLADVGLFGDRYRVAMRPLIEVLRRMRGGASWQDALVEYGATRLAESQLNRAESLLNLTAGGDTETRVKRVARGARRVNAADMAFDSMTEENQALVLRAESVVGALGVLVGAGEGEVRIFPQPGALEFAVVTESGRLWRDFGGVVLDATAPVHDLLALRRDASVVDIAVEDAGESVRVMQFTPGIGRRSLGMWDEGRRLLKFGEIAAESASWVGKFPGKPKVLVLSYKTFLPEILAVMRERFGDGVDLEGHHYGDTRGYDGWFQRGFDVFVTVGDPYANIVSEDRAYELLGIESAGVSIDDYCAYRARAEAAQAHGRGRDPVRKKTSGARVHLHFGRLPPLGWDAENTKMGTGV